MALSQGPGELEGLGISRLVDWGGGRSFPRLQLITWSSTNFRLLPSLPPLDKDVQHVVYVSTHHYLRIHPMCNFLPSCTSTPLYLVAIAAVIFRFRTDWQRGRDTFGTSLFTML